MPILFVRFLKIAFLAMVVFASWNVTLAKAQQASDSSSSSEDNSTVRVLSYNIRYLNNRDGLDVWENRKNKVAEVLQDADIFGLQEAVAKQIEDLQTMLPDRSWYAVPRDNGVTKGEATPIGWRSNQFEEIAKGTFWLSDSPQVVGSKGWDAALPRIASWVRLKTIQNGRELLVINTHFDHRGRIAREQSAALLRRWIGEHANGSQVVLMGDFNSTVDSKPIQKLISDQTSEMRGAEFSDARKLSEVPDPGPNSTWNGFRQVEPKRRIDFIFVSALRVLTFETLNPKTRAGRFASDHLPILATVELPNAE